MLNFEWSLQDKVNFGPQQQPEIPPEKIYKFNCPEEEDSVIN
jgi:hypothetical protein